MPHTVEGSRKRLLIRVLPLVMYTVLVAALYLMRLDVGFDRPALLTAMNAILFLAAMAAAWLATVGFLHGGAAVLLVLGSGVFTFGMASILGPLLIRFYSANAAVTVHNTLALAAAIQLLYSVTGSIDRVVAAEYRVRATVQALLISLGVAGVLVPVAVYELAPTFINADGSTSGVRSLVLAAAIICFASAGVVTAVVARETGERFLRWHSLGLGFIALGLMAVVLGQVGSPIGWAGRVSQLIGQFYILASLRIAVRQPVPGGGPAGAALAYSFQRIQAALLESRAQLGAALHSMTDAVAITDADGEFTALNDAFVSYHRFISREDMPTGARAFFALFDVKDLDGHTVPLGERPTLRALAGQTASEQEYVITRRDSGESWIGSYSYAPIRYDAGELSGAVVVARDVTVRKANEERLSQLLTSERRRRQLIEALHGVMDVSVTSMETSEVAELMLRYLVENHGFEMAGIWLANDDSLELLAEVDFPPYVSERFSSIPLSSAFDAPRVYKTGAPVFVTEFEQMSGAVRERYGSLNAGFGSYAIIPVRSASRTIGTLHFGWMQSRAIGDDDWDFYLSLGHEFGAVLENTRLFALERDIAETLQETLIVVPSQVPGVIFSRAYESATLEKGRVGGDFIDVFRAQGPIVGISLGDVSGKGIDAAVTTSLIRTTLRVHTLDGLSPGDVAMKANAVLRRFTETDTFVTLWFGLLNTETGHLRYVAAGHPPAIVLSRDGMADLECGGPIMGAFDGIEYYECRDVLAAGDRLVVYSDGLTEARSPDGRFLNDEGLREVLRGLASERTQNLASAVMREVVAFSDGVLRDDAAILALELAANLPTT